MPDKIDRGKILLVDDNRENLKFLGNILKENSYIPIAVQHGKAALTFLQEEQVDLILLDVMMPGMDGYDVCEKLKSNKKTKDIPVIFLTAKSEIGDLSRGFDLGAVDYVVKPFNAIELLLRINCHVELKRAREEIVTLRGILPICSVCKKIRDDKGYWHQVEAYIDKHSEVQFSHGYCRDCYIQLMNEHGFEIPDDILDTNNQN